MLQAEEIDTRKDNLIKVCIDYTLNPTASSIVTELTSVAGWYEFVDLVRYHFVGHSNRRLGINISALGILVQRLTPHLVVKNVGMPDTSVTLARDERGIPVTRSGNHSCTPNIAQIA
jgi:hypothetical protein